MDLRPELRVRCLAYHLGFRFRLHRKELPGCPDLVFVSKRKAIFVHGCFWHSHGCKLSHTQKSKSDYWLPKLARIRTRDEDNLIKLTALKWNVLVIWECETQDQEKLIARLHEFLC